MKNGLLINEDEFCKLKMKEQMLILYRNQVKTLHSIEGYKFYYKLTAIIGSILVIGIGILFKLQLGGA